MDQHINDFDFVGQINHQTKGFTHAAPARQIDGTNSIESAIRTKNQQLIGGFSMKNKARRIAIFAVVAIAVVTVVWLANDSPDTDNYGLRPRSRFNGSEQYLPAVVAMLIFTAITQIRRHPIRWWFLGATLTFLLSLTLRTFDMALCDVWPYGTHVFWHLLNGTMIALLLQALIRHIRKAPTP